MWYFFAFLSVYLIVNLITGLLAGRSSGTSPDDYFLAGRKTKTVVLFFTLIATNFSAFFFLGFAGIGYRIGYSYYAMMAFGTAFAALSFYWIGSPVWRLGKRHGYITPIELITKESGSPLLGALFFLFMVGFTLPYLAIQPMGAGKLIFSLSEGTIPGYVGSGALLLLIVVYVWFGGMKSVAITDMLQGILMFVLMFIALWVTGEHFGGLAAANERAFEIKPELFSRSGGGDHFTPQIWFSQMVLWVTCLPMFPHMFSRFFMADTAATLKRSTVLYAIVPLVLFICPIMIGVFGHLEFPNLTKVESDSILPRMLHLCASPWLVSLIMVGAIAAFMSTLDSQLLALSTIATRDLLPMIGIASQKPSRQLFWGRAVIIVFAFLGFLISLSDGAAILDIVKFSFTGYSTLFLPTIAILYFRSTVPNWAIILSIAANGLLIVCCYLNIVTNEHLGGFDTNIAILGLGAIIMATGAMIQQTGNASANSRKSN